MHTHQNNIFIIIKYAHAHIRAQRPHLIAPSPINCAWSVKLYIHNVFEAVGLCPWNLKAPAAIVIQVFCI